MGKETKISWTSTVHPDGTVTPGATWNPWMGCTKVTPECANCYAERDMLRYGKDPHKVVRAKDATFYAPLSWKEPKRIFVCSWSDFFHEAVFTQDVLDAWEVMRQASQHTYIILTKRPQWIEDKLPFDWVGGWPNVWFLISAGTNESLVRFWPILRDIPGLAVKGISMAPLLENLNWRPGCSGIPDWVVVEGESGQNRRLMVSTWATYVQKVCARWSIPFFFKGHIGNVHTSENEQLGGRVYHEFPRVAQQ